MKKTNLISSILYLFFGIIFLLIACLTDTPLDNMFFGFAGAGILPGFMMLCRYFYWNTPQRKQQYAEKIAEEQIEFHDELKNKLRNEAGRYAYILGIFVILFAEILFCILGALGVIENWRIFVLFLFVYLVFQFISGALIFKHLLKKY